MKNISKKFVLSFVFVALALVAGGFYGIQNTSASRGGASMQMMESLPHCGVDSRIGVQKTSPIGNTIMPCCLERHDNSATIVPASSNERVKFSPVTATQQVAISPIILEQKIYSSSPSPPPKADILSSVVLME